MSLYQCEECGCAENTATGSYWFRNQKHMFDWTGIENRQGNELCSFCSPPFLTSGEPSGYGVWHRKFKRTFLPKGQFRTNRQGNLEHSATGDTNYFKYAIPPPETL